MIVFPVIFNAINVSIVFIIFYKKFWVVDNILKLPPDQSDGDEFEVNNVNKVQDIEINTANEENNFNNNIKININSEYIPPNEIVSNKNKSKEEIIPSSNTDSNKLEKITNTLPSEGIINETLDDSNIETNSKEEK
jgi:hypothetical protein